MQIHKSVLKKSLTNIMLNTAKLHGLVPGKKICSKCENLLKQQAQPATVTRVDPDYRPSVSYLADVSNLNKSGTFRTVSIENFQTSRGPESELWQM
jgi:hypothetical protein